MEDLMTVAEYVNKYKKKGISKYLIRSWIADGMRHIGRRPVLIKEEWVEEYMENIASRPNMSLKKGKKNIKRIPIKHISTNDNKIKIEDFM